MSTLHSIKSAFIMLLMASLLMLIAVSMGVVYLIVTPAGGKLLIDYTLNKYASIASMSVGSYEGSIDQGFVLKDIRITDWPAWPIATIHIQQAKVQIPLWSWQKVSVDVLNGRVFLPTSDPIVFGGQFTGGLLKGNVYAKAVDVHECVSPFASEEMIKGLEGSVDGVDLQISGPLMAFKIVGHLFVDHVKYKITTVNDAFTRVDLTVQPVGEIWPLFGEVVVDSGFVETHKVMVDLRKSKVGFSGDAFNPALELYGDTYVEDIDISFSILGTAAKPQLKMDSDPPLPEDVLLLVLVTGKSWSGASSSLSKGALNSDLMSGFMDYFFLGGKGGQFSKTYGLKLGLELEQMPTQAGSSGLYSRKLEGEVAVSDHVSVNVSKKILPQEHSPATSSQRLNQEGETEIYLKYKEKF